MAFVLGVTLWVFVFAPEWETFPTISSATPLPAEPGVLPEAAAYISGVWRVWRGSLGTETSDGYVRNRAKGD